MLVAAAVLGAPQVARADWVDGSTGDDGTVEVRAGTGPIVLVGGGRSSCVWDHLTNREAMQLDGFGGRIEADPDDPVWDEWFQTTINGVLVDGYVVTCPNRPIGFRWVDLTVDATDLIPAILAKASEIIELRVPNLNPAVGPGGYVNLGMWLAVGPASYPDITAFASPNAWITASPTVGSTTFDFGNGDRVTCGQFGTPIVDLDTADEGPCGYTYRQPGTYTLTITTEWLLPYISSDGPGTIPPLQRATTVTYEVREIQTIGTSG